MKTRNAIQLGVLLLLIAALAVTGLAGFSVGIYDILPFSQTAYAGMDLSGGTSVYYQLTEQAEAETDDAAALINRSVDIIKDRLFIYGVNEATVRREGTNGLRITLPAGENSKTETTAYILNFAATQGLIELRDPVDETVFSTDNIEEAMVASAGNGYAIQVTLDETGKTALKESLERYIGRTYAIYLNGTKLTDSLQGFLNDTGVFNLTGFSSEAEAQSIAIQILSGALPTFQTAVQLPIQGAMGDTSLSAAYQAVLIAALVMMLLLIVLFRLPGLASALSLGTYMLLFLLVAILSGMTLTWPAFAAWMCGFILLAAACFVYCARMKRDMNAVGGVFADSVRQSLKKMLPALGDGIAVVFILAFTLLCFELVIIKSFGVSLLVAILLLFICMLLPVQLTRNLVNLGVNKPWLYGVKGGDKS
ncbi:MAG: SecDF P1 head subdomain-containing protein [Christensenellales bacterium]|jgi:preprotein translocase subunit SecD